MSVYKFKIYFEDDESISREIEIRSSHTFQDFHKIIQNAIGFDSLHPASFFISNDLWRQGKEIMLMPASIANGVKGTWMHETKIASCVEDPHQKFIYEFDPEGGNWILHAELVKIIPEAAVAYPRIGKTVGTSPAQYKITAPVMAPAEEEDELMVDDAQDEYVHPEVAVPDHYHTTDEEEPVLMVKAAEPEEEYKEDGMDGEEEEAENSDSEEEEDRESFA